MIVGILPIELFIKERREKYIGIPSEEARRNLMARWQEKWTNAGNGRWTYRLRAETDSCGYGGHQDDVEHTLFICPTWNIIRQPYNAATDRSFNVLIVADDPVSLEAQWKIKRSTVRDIIQTKEIEER